MSLCTELHVEVEDPPSPPQGPPHGWSWGWAHSWQQPQIPVMYSPDGQQAGVWVGVGGTRGDRVEQGLGGPGGEGTRGRVEQETHLTGPPAAGRAGQAVRRGAGGNFLNIWLWAK